MSALIKLNTASRKTNYIRLSKADGVEVRDTESGMGIELSRPHVYVASGEKSGEVLDGPAKAGQKLRLWFGTLAPFKYQVLVAVNPALLAEGQVQAPSIIEPGDEVDLDVWVRPDKSWAVPGSWIVRLYMID